MNHFTSPSFWECYNNLSKNIQKLSDKNFDLRKENPNRPGGGKAFQYLKLAISEADVYEMYFVNIKKAPNKAELLLHFAAVFLIPDNPASCRPLWVK